MQTRGRIKRVCTEHGTKLRKPYRKETFQTRVKDKLLRPKCEKLPAVLEAFTIIA